MADPRFSLLNPTHPPLYLLSRCPLLVEFALATLKIALNGWNSSFLLHLINYWNLVLLTHPWTRPLPAVFNHLNLTDRAQNNGPLATVKRRENRLRWLQRLQRNGVTLRPPIKGRIPPINGSTRCPLSVELSSRDRSLAFH